MRTDVLGRIRNATFAASKPLLPLYEAVVNSIQAIEDRQVQDGRIEVCIFRDTQQPTLDGERGFNDIEAFAITDNGIGFTDANYNAFQTADTTYKLGRGGKGIGRFLWLAAFDRVTIESVFLDGTGMNRRQFDFEATDEGISNMRLSPAGNNPTSTTVTLNGFKKKYKDHCPKKISTIAACIIEHCLEYFIRPTCPRMTLRDGATGEVVDLQSVFASELAPNRGATTFMLNGVEFHLLHVRLYSSHIREHLLHYCGNSRVVKSEKLQGQIPNLGRRLEDDASREFVYAGYLDSTYLDESVDQLRTDFSIPQDDDTPPLMGISWHALKEASFNACRDFLHEFTESTRQRKIKRIESFVASDAPMYRPIIRHIPEAIDRIDPEIKEADLEIKLYEAYQQLQLTLKAEGSVLLSAAEGGTMPFDEYETKLKEYFDKINDINAADLARYVCHRKAVLDFLHHQLSIAPSGKYYLEGGIHNIIFPMGKTSEEVSFCTHNLWVIDEKLSYHRFLASDKQLRTIPVLASESQKEPDIIVFDKACAFAAADDPPFPAIVIIEFKRPMREGYTEDKNPFVQVREYIEVIRDGRARYDDGREVPILPGVPFYCYIICDLNESLKRQAMDFELEQTPDGQGFFGYKRHYGAYFEVVSYTKMVTDAKKRNAVLFNKLGLPSRIG